MWWQRCQRGYYLTRPVVKDGILGAFSLAAPFLICFMTISARGLKLLPVERPRERESSFRKQTSPPTKLNLHFSNDAADGLEGELLDSGRLAG
jgi:hypothetical protein